MTINAAVKGRVTVAKEKVEKKPEARRVVRGKIKEPSIWFKLTHLYLFAVKDKAKVRTECL